MTTIQNHTIQKTLFTGDSRSISKYLPGPQGFAPQLPGTDTYPPEYGFDFHPLWYKLGEQQRACASVGNEYASSQNYLVYTQTIEQRRHQIFSYYRYDQYLRLIETGEAKPQGICSYNQSACRKMTNAEASAQVLALSRTNVLVAIYNAENPFPHLQGSSHLYDKIEKICYYDQIDADTPQDTTGQYCPADEYLEITYLYSNWHYISTITQQCTAIPVEAESLAVFSSIQYNPFSPAPVTVEEWYINITKTAYTTIWNKSRSLIQHTKPSTQQFSIPNAPVAHNIIDSYCLNFLLSNFYAYCRKVYNYCLRTVNLSIRTLRSVSHANCNMRIIPILHHYSNGPPLFRYTVDIV